MTKVLKGVIPAAYKISDLAGQAILGIVYFEELKAAVCPDTYEIEKIIRSRHNPTTGAKEYYVSWLGYPSSTNSWISQKDMVKI